MIICLLNFFLIVHGLAAETSTSIKYSREGGGGMELTTQLEEGFFAKKRITLYPVKYTAPYALHIYPKKNDALSIIWARSVCVCVGGGIIGHMVRGGGGRCGSADKYVRQHPVMPDVTTSQLLSK